MPPTEQTTQDLATEAQSRLAGSVKGTAGSQKREHKPNHVIPLLKNPQPSLCLQDKASEWLNEAGNGFGFSPWTRFWKPQPQVWIPLPLTIEAQGRYPGRVLLHKCSGPGLASSWLPGAETDSDTPQSTSESQTFSGQRPTRAPFPGPPPLPSPPRHSPA